MYVYLLTFANGKRYVGQTSNGLDKRLAAHRTQVRLGSKLPVHCAWRTHGEPGLTVVAECATEAEMHAAEIDAIKRLGTVSPGGYNVCAGGQTAPSKNPVVARKISEKALGRLHTDEVKAGLSYALKQRWLDPEYRAKVDAGVAKSWTPERRAAAAERTRLRNLGSKHSAETIEKMRAPKSSETRARMSDSAKGRKKRPRSEVTCSKMAANTAAFWLDPDRKAERIAAVKAAWTPERRAAHGEMLAAVHARKRAES